MEAWAERIKNALRKSKKEKEKEKEDEMHVVGRCGLSHLGRGTCTLLFGENRPFEEAKNRENEKERKHVGGQGRDRRLPLAAWPALGLKVHGPPSSGGRCDISTSCATTASASVG